jgi:predicted flap endonuclease-1-like 5' DNA nuclease
MGFLLAQILILLLLAAACGAGLSWWWFRRHYDDVTLEYSDWRDELEAWRRDFEERLAARPEVDLRPLSRQLGEVDAAVRGIEIPLPMPTNLNPVLEAIADIRIPEMPPPADLTPLAERLSALEDAVRSIRLPQPQTVDLSPVLERLAALEARLERPSDQPADQPTEAREAREAQESSRNLLAHASHGKPDDLTQIRGISRTLQRTLHKVGVFYFWQIADWSSEDVAYVDSRLASYRGRIERYDWRAQASELASQPNAAHRPAEH